mmetsp:Transcript_15012/g.16255  ORF Transcript_15012/g.16255 Transcript_15012/m.16255 type:complete len:161 (-) Transcript_15012:66-548(-)|eukprot:gene1637-1733_t
MLKILFRYIILLLLLAHSLHGFLVQKTSVRISGSIGRVRPEMKRISTSTLSMGLFDFFSPKKSASASHILVKGEDAPKFLTELKQKISSSRNVPDAFADAARQYSACPSAKNGGALGTFKQGMMVPAFDKVVFSEAIGVVHGPVKTPFGAHLILIDNREE